MISDGSFEGRLSREERARIRQEIAGRLRNREGDDAPLAFEVERRVVYMAEVPACLLCLGGKILRPVMASRGHHPSAD